MGATHSKSSSSKTRRAPGPEWFTKLRNLLLRSRFQIIPYGDGRSCFGRANREQSIAMGVVPVIWDHCIERRKPVKRYPYEGPYDWEHWQRTPWSELFNWSTFSVRTRRMTPPDET